MLTQAYLNTQNAIIPNNYLWDGFWIDNFKQGILDVSASFDKGYYRDINIQFTGVIFFNLPKSWRDNEVDVTQLLQLKNIEEFNAKFLNFNITNKNIIGIDIQIYKGPENPPDIHTFYIVCDSVLVTKYRPSDENFLDAYTDPMQHNTEYPCLKNRIV